MQCYPTPLPVTPLSVPTLLQWWYGLHQWPKQRTCKHCHSSSHYTPTPVKRSDENVLDYRGVVYWPGFVCILRVVITEYTVHALALIFHTVVPFLFPFPSHYSFASASLSPSPFPSGSLILRFPSLKRPLLLWLWKELGTALGLLTGTVWRVWLFECSVMIVLFLL